MKTFKRIVIWSIISLLLQSCLFFIIDKYYQETLLNTKVNEVIVKKQNEVDLNPSVKIPTTADKIQASFDGKYISYYYNSKLIVINLYTGKSNIISDKIKSELIYSKWQPDVDSIILCERNLSSKSYINIFIYNANNNKEQAPTDTNNKAIKFNMANKNNTISDIQMSPMMQIFYIKVARTNSTSDVFNNNVNGETVRIFNTKYIGRIRTFQRKPNLIYEDTSSNLIKVSNISWSLGNMQACLFNTDNNDNIYIGVLKNGTVYKIMYGSTKQSFSKWTSISLDSPVAKENINVTKNGSIYINNNLRGDIKDQVSKKNVSYTGTFLQIAGNKIISLDNGIVKRVTLP